MDGMLPGGNMSAVERVGDTVRRTAGAWTPTVHRYLDYVARRGVTTVPRPRGIQRGREILDYIDGDVPSYPLPAWVWDDAVLVDGARFLRRLHDASVGFPLADTLWQSPTHQPVEVICHNDFAPHNLVFEHGAIVGAIDFDMCSPGPRIWDIAYFATRAVPLTGSPQPGAPDVTDARRRVAVILDAYSAETGDPGAAGATGATGDIASKSWCDVLEVAILRLRLLADFSKAKAAELGTPELRDHAADYERDAAYLQAVLDAAA